MFNFNKIQQNIDRAIKRAEELERLAELLAEEDVVEGNGWDFVPAGTDKDMYCTMLLCNQGER